MSLKLNTEYRQCTKCLMDTTDPEITFDGEGICNHCYELKDIIEKSKSKDEKDKILEDTIKKIKLMGKNKKYDCIIGLSGGVDSSYLAYFVKQKGLKPLAVHFDNGWDSELAVYNIENIVKKLNIDLYTYVVNWEEFKDLQLAYFKAGVIDLEIPTDYYIFAVLFQVALKYKLKYIINGNNSVTEALLPKSWIYANKFDMRNILDIHKKFGTKKLTNFPKFGKWQRYLFNYQGYNLFPILDYIEYNKYEAKKIISERLDWRDYGGKHYESIFTRFYQGYILPKRFGVDKRKAHLSNLIITGQITKEDALKEISNNPYTVELQNKDKNYLIKKFAITENEFENYMNLTHRDHKEFAHEKSIYSDYPLLNFLRPFGSMLKKLFSK